MTATAAKSTLTPPPPTNRSGLPPVMCVVAVAMVAFNLGSCGYQGWADGYNTDQGLAASWLPWVQVLSILLYLPAASRMARVNLRYWPHIQLVFLLPGAALLVGAWVGQLGFRAGVTVMARERGPAYFASVQCATAAAAAAAEPNFDHASGDWVPIALTGQAAAFMGSNARYYPYWHCVFVPSKPGGQPACWLVCLDGTTDTCLLYPELFDPADRSPYASWVYCGSGIWRR